MVPECESTPPKFETNGWGLWALPEDGGRCSRLTPLGDSCVPESFHLNQTQSCSSWVYETDNSIISE
ncbi:Organic cation transporter, partial [Operophtera brumata]